MKAILIFQERDCYKISNKWDHKEGKGLYLEVDAGLS